MPWLTKIRWLTMPKQNKCIIETPFAHGYYLDHQAYLNGEIEEVWTPKRIVFYHYTDKSSNPEIGIVLELHIPDSVHLPVLECLFHELCHRKIKEHTNGTKGGYARALAALFAAIGDRTEHLNNKGFFASLFRTLVANDVNKKEYNQMVCLLSSAVKKHQQYNVPYCMVLKYAIDELPKTVDERYEPRKTLGAKLLPNDSSGSDEKALWRSLIDLFEYCWQLIRSQDEVIKSLYGQNPDKWLKAVENLPNPKSWETTPAEIKAHIRTGLYQFYPQKDELPLKQQKKESLLALNLRPAKKAYFPDSENPSDLYAHYIKTRNDDVVGFYDRANPPSVLNPTENSRVRIPVNVNLWLPSASITPSELLLKVCAALLYRYQFTESAVKGLTPSDLTYNSDTGTLQVGGIKTRGGPNPDANRGQVHIFNKASRYEREMFLFLKNKLDAYYQYHGLDVERDTIHSQFGAFGNVINSWYPLEQSFAAFPNAFPAKCHLFLSTWCKTKEETKHLTRPGSRLSLTSTDLSYTAKTISLASYYMREKENADSPQDGEQKSPMPDEIEHQMNATQRGHTVATDDNVYLRRMTSPVMLEKDARSHNQVSKRMIDEARVIGNRARVCNLQELCQEMGIHYQSELMDPKKGLEELLEKAGHDVTDFLGIKHDEQMVFVKHPLVLAFILLYIEHIDTSLDELIVDQSALDIMLSEKVIQVAALRMVLAVMAEEFEPPLHNQAEKYIRDYQLPTFAPLL